MLLSLFALFLCGAVVIFVSTTHNYKQMYEDSQRELGQVQSDKRSLEQQLNDKIQAMNQLSTRLNNTISSLEAEKQKLETNLKNAERTTFELQEKVQNLAGSAMKFEQTVASMEGSLKQTRQELDESRASSIKLQKDLNEVTAMLEEKMAQLESVEIERKRLLEKIVQIENHLAPGADTSAADAAQGVITTDRDTAQPAEPVSSDVSIKGYINGVSDGLVTISVGSADGVRKGTRFHVVRQANFVCDLVITHVDTDTSAGNIELVTMPPQVGDVASTTW